MIKNKFLNVFLIAFLLSVHFILGFQSMKSESPTFDEPLHISGGVFYWKFNDYHMNSESGIFPQRLAALPVVLDDSIKVPALEKYTIINHQFTEAWRFLFKSGNDPDKIFAYGRTMILLLSVVLGLIVYLWSRELFGADGALISLTLYAFCPSVLANARLITADLAISFSFIISVWALWKFLHEINIRNTLASSLALFILFISKMSAVFIVPVFLVMLAAHIFTQNELPVKLWNRRLILKGQGTRFCAYILSLMLMGIVVWGMLWAVYGFRYSMLSDEKRGREWVDVNWTYLTRNDSFVNKVILFARDNKLVPEAYLFGFTHTYDNSRGRDAFMNGQLCSTGRYSFFPYCALVKTPIPFMGLLFLLLLAAFVRWKKSGHFMVCMKNDLYKITPLIALLFIYGIFAITARLNLGLRHILLFYPALYILCGGLVYYFRQRLKYIKFCILLLLALFIYENLRIYPHYLAYFNSFAGGAENAYKHLVDSSLDWGQDLKNLKNYIAGLEKKEGVKKNVYLSYFGGVDVTYYMPDAKIISSFLEQPMKDIYEYDFDNGIFCISATRLQMGDFNGVPWNEEHEKLLLAILKDIKFFNETRKSPEAFAELIKGDKIKFWMQRVRDFENLRFAKLVALLRQRKPDAEIGYSILIYKMPDARIKEAFKDIRLK